MDRDAINDQIERILRSRSFAGKGQLRKLLDVLWQNFDSQTSLKPDRVIKELWPQETRTKGSADVATEMNRLRHALEDYYNGEDSNDPITVEIKTGTPPKIGARLYKISLPYVGFAFGRGHGRMGCIRVVTANP